MRIIENDVLVDLTWASLCGRLDVDGIVRLRPAEHDEASDGRTRLTHFNLQACHHRPGLRYAFLRIERPGFFDGTAEEVPHMSVRFPIRGRCTEVRNHVPYDELQERDFFNSFSDAQSPSMLRRSILARYRQSMPHLTEERILGLGVSVSAFCLHQNE